MFASFAEHSTFLYSSSISLHLGAACRLIFAYQILTPAALQFFVQYADGAVESLWSIDQYFEFVLVLLLSTGLSFQVGKPVLPSFDSRA